MFVERVGQLKAGDRSPLYRQLERRLHDAIDARVLAPGEALPPERDLAAAYQISRVTVRKAIDALVDARLLTRRRGAGTYVAAPIEKNFANLSSFTEDMEGRGRTASSSWITRTIGVVTPEEALALGLSPGSAVTRLSRVRHADGVSMAIEHSSIPADILPSAEAVGASLYATLGAARPTRVLQRLRAVMLDPGETALLGIEGPAAGLLIERRGFAANGRAVEFTRSLYRGDGYDIVSELGGS